jgi:DNA-binding MarR family transcriptional regulator
MTPQSMSEVLEALEQKQLVERTPSPTHRRVFPAALTAKGRTVLEACNEAVDELEHEMLAGMTPHQARNLRKGLVKAVRALHAGFPSRRM